MKRWAIGALLPVAWLLAAGWSGGLAVWLAFTIAALAWPVVARRATAMPPRARLVIGSVLLAAAAPIAWLLMEQVPRAKGGDHDVWEFTGAAVFSLMLLYGSLVGLPGDGRPRRIVAGVALLGVLACAVLALFAGITWTFTPVT